MRSLLILLPKTHIRTLSLLDFTLDAAGERIAIFDRRDMKLLHTSTSAPSMKIILPKIYTTNKLILALLVDDDLENQAVVVDGIKAEAIDANTYNINS